MYWKKWRNCWWSGQNFASERCRRQKELTIRILLRKFSKNCLNASVLKPTLSLWCSIPRSLETVKMADQLSRCWLPRASTAWKALCLLQTASYFSAAILGICIRDLSEYSILFLFRLTNVLRGSLLEARLLALICASVNHVFLNALYEIWFSFMTNDLRFVIILTFDLR